MSSDASSAAARPPLSPRAAPIMDQLQGEEILGASRQLQLAGELFLAVTEDHDGTPAELIETLAALSADLIRSRGDSSQAIPNAIALMLRGLPKQAGADLDDLRHWVTNAVTSYIQEQRQWMERIAAAGADLLRDAQRVVAYDYSSSVSALMQALPEDRDGGPALVLLESRPLDGGAKYLADGLATARDVTFLPDAAMVEALLDADAVLVGAETISAEGGCFNTIGTLLLAIAAHSVGVPFYVATTTVKIDVATLDEPEREIPTRDLSPILAERWQSTDAAAVEFSCPDLDYTPPRLITGFITEHGILEPPQLRQYAHELASALEGDHL